MRYLPLLALLAAATTAAGPAERDADLLPENDVVDAAVLETVDAPAAVGDELAEPLRRVAEDLDRTLENRRGPAWHAPDMPAANFVAAVR